MGSVILSLVLMGADPGVVERLDKLISTVDVIEQMGMFTCGLELREQRRDSEFLSDMAKFGPEALPVLEGVLREIWTPGSNSKYGLASRQIHRAYGRLGGESVLGTLFAQLGPEGNFHAERAIAEAADLSEFRSIIPHLTTYIRCGRRPTTSALMELVDRWYGGQRDKFAGLLGPRALGELNRLGLRFVEPPENEWLVMGLRTIDGGQGEYEFVDRELVACGKVKLQAIEGSRGPAFDFEDLAVLVRTIEGCAARSRRTGAVREKPMFGP